MSKVIRLRNPKINNKQKKILLQFLADYPSVYFHRITTAFTFEDHVLFWKQAASVLNMFGPPVKTPEIWKKAWKDMRLRYKKSGIDTKQILRALKCERIVDTKALLDNVEKISCTKGIQRVHLLEQCGVNVSYLDDDNNDIVNYTGRTLRRTANSTDFKIDISKTREVAAELGIADLEEKLLDSKDEFELESKAQLLDESCEELYLDVEDVTGNFRNDSETEITFVDESKLPQTDSEVDDDVNQIAAQRISEVVPSESTSNNSNNSKKIDNSSNKLLSSILVELRKHNNLQQEKLDVQRNFINQQKTTMQRMLDVQTEMAKAQTALANTVKTFVNNISFDS